MAHDHLVYDVDKRFVIDPETRVVKIPNNSAPVLIQYDHNSEYITFETKRHVEGHDLLKSNEVEIHFNNVASNNRATNRSVYKVEDLKVDPSNNEKLVFTWAISRNATLHAGHIDFVISFSCVDDMMVEYRWNTHPNSDLIVTPGIYNGEAVAQSYADVLEVWRQRLFGVSETEEAVMIELGQTIRDSIEAKGEATLKTIPNEYLDYSDIANSVDVPSAILFTQSGYLNSVGEYNVNAQYGVTDYILYTSGDILLRGISVGASALGVGFYDVDKNFISGRNNLEGTIIIPGEEVPDGAKYIRSSTLLSSSINPAVFINTYGTVAKTEAFVEDLKTELRDLRQKIDRELIFTVGGYIFREGVINPTENAQYTDYTVVEGYSKIKVKASLSEVAYLLAYYDEDKVFLPNISVLGSGLVEASYDVPKGAYYVRVSNYGLDTEHYAILYNESIAEIYKSYENKRILTLGDSITAIESSSGDYSRSWKKYFCEVVKPSLLVSTAVSGAHWRDKPGTVYDGNPVINGADDNVNNVIGNQVEKIIRLKGANDANYEDFDVIFIAAGTNDLDDASSLTDSDIEKSFYNGSEAITDLSTLDRTTWAGAMRYTIDSLRSLYPNADIFVCTPIQKVGPNGYRDILNKSNGMKKIIRRLGAILVDSTECGVYDMTCPSGGQEGDYNDGLHLSPQGAKKLGHYNARQMINYYSFDIE